MYTLAEMMEGQTITAKWFVVIFCYRWARERPSIEADKDRVATIIQPIEL